MLYVKVEKHRCIRNKSCTAFQKESHKLLLRQMKKTKTKQAITSEIYAQLVKYLGSNLTDLNLVRYVTNHTKFRLEIHTHFATTAAKLCLNAMIV